MSDHIEEAVIARANSRTRNNIAYSADFADYFSWNFDFFIIPGNAFVVFASGLIKLDGGVRFVYPERKDSELNYTVEYSTDLLVLQGSGFVQQVQSESYDANSRKAVFEMIIEEDALFVRFKASLHSIQSGTAAAHYTTSWLYT